MADLPGYLASHRIAVHDGGQPLRCTYPWPTFDHAKDDVAPELLAALRAAFKEPTPVQAVCWPALSSGRDMVVVAETGSGKTLAFAIPMLSKLARGKAQPTQQCKALIVVPTRELAAQIHREMGAYARVVCGVQCVCCYGGTDITLDLEAIADGVHVLTATPGRLLQLVQRHGWILENVDAVAVDEADRMLDMGFEPQVREVFASLPAECQLAFFSATWPPHVHGLAADFLHGPVRVHIGPGGSVDKLAAVRTVTQRVEVLREVEKGPRLRALLQDQQAGRVGHQGDGLGVLVFVNTKASCARLCAELNRDGTARADCIHGDRLQADREAALASFAHGEIGVLVATDVAARGLDIPNIPLVINYDFPMAIGEQGIEDYVHRVGRTGRAKARGMAVTFFSTDSDTKLAHSLISVLENSGQEVPASLRRLDQGPAISARAKRQRK